MIESHFNSWEMCVEIIKTFHVKFFPLGSPQNGMSHHWRLLIKHLKGDPLLNSRYDSRCTVPNRNA